MKFNEINKTAIIGSYENNDIQKVYWTDGKNQPRVINIVGEIKENIDLRD